MRFEKEKTVGDKDCTECCFSETCYNECRLEIGWHYRDNSQTGAGSR